MHLRGMEDNHKILFIATLTAILFSGQSQDYCEQSERVEDIPDLESCIGVGTFISVIYRPPSGASNCGSIDDDYHILIYHHDFDRSIAIEKHPPPERYNDTACLVHLTLSPDIFVKENNDTLLQVWMKLVTMSADTYCSNNFTLLVDTDPPDPVNPQIHVGCNSVDVEWPPPFSPPGCPVRQYDIELNDEYFNITNTSLLHHSWPDLSPNMLNTLNISAVNDIGPSIQSNNTFITALNPQVMFLDYDVLLNDSNALFTIKAKVNNNCIYSVPTHFYYNASCDANTTVNETWDVSNEQTSYQLPVPIDRLNCTACLIWSNLNSSLTRCNITFNTTQLLFINLQPINNGLNFTCHYRPNSSLWDCGVSVNNSLNDTRSALTFNETIGTITNLCPGKYDVAMFYVKDGMDYVIEYVTVNISGTSCGTPTPSGTDDDNNKNNLLKSDSYFNLF
ncbi:PREDICTED: uncharacterized protein LOC100633174 [Amphimedon queenslandica]|uniref:Fibronectin type-III domain-containing protein n=1 Tax=Amphimedon queenslandica TaxID=400682 RepID=A0AAN0IEC0_AMPQE|nr:PREDICTED: uncharacterized protein LOC100633174 [Amphimedon queenslandica]|eukprot:XP_003386782.2 PREDICTED: uncharacterized protein LOC100633174 [Amphimedon queenslandica]